MARRHASVTRVKDKLSTIPTCRLIDDQGGVTALEYALIALLVAIAIVTAVQLLGSGLSNMFHTVATSV